jgi:hypothetical protein
MITINSSTADMRSYNTVGDIAWLNHCDRRITHLGDFDISFVLF